MSTVYRRKVEQLTEAPNADETTRNGAVEIIRSMVSAIRLAPNEDGGLDIELVGELAAIMSLGDEDRTPDKK